MADAAVEGKEEGRAKEASRGGDLDSTEYTIRVPKGYVGRCREIERFECLGRLGEGTFGIVYRARDLDNGNIVAVKRIKIKEERVGLPQSSLREINMLKAVRHENVVRLLEMAVGQAYDQVYLILEYCEHDLGWLIDNLPAPFPETVAKSLTVQLLKGLNYLHSKFIIHRDVKLSNLLLDQHGYLKIADFGLARMCEEPPRPKSGNVVTLWYRAPELLFGEQAYDSKVDCWSAGCVMAEFIAHKPLMPGKSEASQLDLMIQLLGTPNEAIWPGFSSLPLTPRFRLTSQPYSNLRHEFRYISDKGVDLLGRLLTYDPKQRWSCAQALSHPYFREFPYPCTPDMMPTFPTQGRGGGEAVDEWEMRSAGGRSSSRGRVAGRDDGSGGRSTARRGREQSSDRHTKSKATGSRAHRR